MPWSLKLSNPSSQNNQILKKVNATIMMEIMLYGNIGKRASRSNKKNTIFFLYLMTCILISNISSIIAQ